MEDAMLKEALRIFEERAKDAKSEAEVEKILELVQNAMAEAVQSTTDTNARTLADGIERRMPALLRDRRREFGGFERRLHETWSDALDRLEALIHLHVEYGSMLANEVFANNPALQTPKTRALSRLHARACRVGLEAFTLLKAGLSDGAHARWRTLHEVATVALFLREHNDETATRYFQHASIRRAKRAATYQEYCERLGLKPLRAEEVERINRARDNLADRFGRSFLSDYGWASVELGKERPTFRDIEAVTLPHFRPDYGWASGGVHAGAEGLDPLGLQLAPWIPFLPGPSNAGLADPGQMVAISLAQASAATMLAEPKYAQVIMNAALGVLTIRCQAAFMRGHRKVEALRKKDLREHAQAIKKQRTARRKARGD